MRYQHMTGAMDVRRLNAFVAVAEHGTMLKASRLLHITQPALSRQISGLEADLGFALFDRVGRRLLITPRGEQLLGDCRSLLTQAGALRERVQSLRRGDIQVLRVAASSEPVESLFPAFLHEYARRQPGVRLELVEADSAEQVRLLERGEVHLAANVINVIALDEQRFGHHRLPQFHVVAASAPALGFSPSNTIDIRRLADHPLLLPKPNFATRILFDAACRLAAVRANIFVESVSAHALLALAEAGHGVAIVPSIMRPERHPLQTMAVTHKRERLHIAPAILWNRRRTLPRYAKEFAELLSDHILRAFAGDQTAGETLSRAPATVRGPNVKRLVRLRRKGERKGR